jgi:hypothetical protein
MRIHISELSARPSGKNTQVPVMSTYEWTMPFATSPKPTLTRRDYIFVNYLVNSALPSDEAATKYDPEASLAFLSQTGNGRCNPQPGCREQYALALLKSLTINMQADITRPAPPSLSASSVREWLNPSDAELDITPQSVSFEFQGRQLRLFDQWDSTYFSSPAVELLATKQKSTFYDSDQATARGHALVEIEVPVRIERESESRYFPIYWSIADVERRLGAPVIGLRRQVNYLAKALRERLIPLIPPTQNDPVAAQGYFTVWFKQVSPFANRFDVSLGAAGYIFPAKTSKNDTKSLGLLKEQTLIAPGDVLILGERKSAGLGVHKSVTDDPGYR